MTARRFRAVVVLAFVAALLLCVAYVVARHVVTGVWPGRRWPVWVQPVRRARVGRPRSRFAGANPYCIYRGEMSMWVPRPSYAQLVAHFVWTPPPALAPVVYIGRPPVLQDVAA